jgi:hypothetical protein
MPLEVRIDPERELIYAGGKGLVTDQDLLGYIREYLLEEDLSGYDEFFDFSEADLLDLTYTGLAEVASAAAATDSETKPTKIAVLVSEASGMGLSRMYQVLRGDKGGSRNIRLFWHREECLDWLSLDEVAGASDP